MTLTGPEKYVGAKGGVFILFYQRAHLASLFHSAAIID